MPKGYNKSITELEYRKAVDAGKKCLIFLLHEEASWPRNFIDKGEDLEKIEALRDELSDDKTVSFFKSAEELASLVGAAVHNWEKEGKSETKTAIQEIMNLYNPSALPYYPKILKEFVTENRDEELRKARTYLENHRILLISGVGGVGKTTLARALIDLRPANVPEPFWFSFYDNQDAKLGDILEKLAAYMNAPEIASFKAEKREPGKIDVDKLTGELHRRSEVWLIFDDLNTVLEDIRFSDKGIELLFSSLRYNTHNAKVIITSRVFPKLENGESLIDVVEGEDKQHLNGLRKDFAVNYLVSNGLDKVEPEKLGKLATEVDGHPLALRLLVELVKEYGVTDILEDLSEYKEQREDTILKARKLFDKLAGGEKELLERISVYRKPVTMSALKAMFTEKTPRDSVSKLLNKSLIETNQNGSFWLHPLIQEFAYKELKDTIEANINAYRYYIFLPLPEKPSKIEDIQSLIEAHYHACSAGRVDLAARILFYSNLCGQLETWGNFKTIVELCTPLLPFISLEGRTTPLECHGYFLGMLGIAYFRLRLAEEAVFFLEAALKTARLRKDKKGEANQLGNLGLVYHQLGDNRKSIEYYEQVIEIAKEIEDKHVEGSSYGNLGNAFLGLGEIEKAITNYKNAVQMLKDAGYERGAGIYLGNLGVLYSQIGKINESVDFLEQSLRISKESRDKIEEKNQHMNLGVAYKNAGMLEKSIECYKKALKISIEIEDERGEGDLLGNIGNLFLISGQGREAIEYFEQSLKIDRNTRNKQGESISLASLGASYATIGQLETAVEFYEKALNIAKEIGDIRTESLIQVNMGGAYFKLGQVERALSFFEKALFIGKKIQDPRIIEKCENALNSKDNRIIR